MEVGKSEKVDVNSHFDDLLCGGGRGTGCDYLKLWLLAGIPFGIHRMFLWIIPKGFDIGGTVGVVVLNFLVGGLIGGVIMIWQVGAAFLVLARGAVCGAMRVCRRHIVG